MKCVRFFPFAFILQLTIRAANCRCGAEFASVSDYIADRHRLRAVIVLADNYLTQ